MKWRRDQKIKIIDEVKKRKKMSCREIAEEFNIGKMQAANVVASHKKRKVMIVMIRFLWLWLSPMTLVLEKNMKTSWVKVTNTFDVETTKNLKPSSTYSTRNTKNVKPQAWSQRHWTILKEEARNIKLSLNQSGLEDFIASDR